MSRETELRTAITKAALPLRDFKVYSVLLGRSEWNTAELGAKWQPRSLTELAQWCNLPRSVVAVSLNHLEHHKWIERDRWRTPGRGHSTRYRLSLGSDCDCCESPNRNPATASAIRTRRWREAKKASVQRTLTEDKASVQQSIKRPARRHTTAGQTPFRAKEGREEGGVEEERQNCTACGTPLDPVLTRCRYSTHPCCGPGETLPGQKITYPGKEHAQALALLRETFGEVTVLADRIRQPGPWGSRTQEAAGMTDLSYSHGQLAKNWLRYHGLAYRRETLATIGELMTAEAQARLAARLEQLAEEESNKPPQVPAVMFQPPPDDDTEGQ